MAPVVDASKLYDLLEKLARLNPCGGNIVSRFAIDVWKFSKPQ